MFHKTPPKSSLHFTYLHQCIIIIINSGYHTHDTYHTQTHTQLFDNKHINHNSIRINLSNHFYSMHLFCIILFTWNSRYMIHSYATERYKIEFHPKVCVSVYAMPVCLWNVDKIKYMNERENNMIFVRVNLNSTHNYRMWTV